MFYIYPILSKIVLALSFKEITVCALVWSDIYRLMIRIKIRIEIGIGIGIGVGVGMGVGVGVAVAVAVAVTVAVAVAMTMAMAMAIARTIGIICISLATKICKVQYRWAGLKCSLANPTN